MIIVIINIILLNIFLIYLNYSFRYKFNSKYESVLHPYLWSCPYRTPNNKYNNSYKSQFNEDYTYFKNFFKNKLNGIYVELGALDGIKISNTYFFENYLGWSGILIEGGINNCYSLIKNQYLRPRSQIICTAICKDNDYIDFKQGGSVGGIEGEIPPTWFNMEKRKGIKTKCSHIGNILNAYHITHIDFFSLDVEGSELNVLETFDFSIIVNYWVIEFNSKNDMKNNLVRKLLLSNGYVRCKIKLEYSNECYEYPKYKSSVNKLIQIENKYRTNFGCKC